MPVATISSVEALLTAAYRLTQEGRTPFSAETLIVEAWKAHPDKFGMKAHDYPDSHRAMSYLCGARGLVGRGYLSRSAGGHTLTSTGRRWAMKLSGESASPPLVGEGEARPGRLEAEQDALLRKLFAVAGRKRPVAEWNFTEACFWWSWKDVAATHAAAFVAVQLAEIAKLLAGRRCVLWNGRETTADEVAELIELDDALRQRFAAHLKVMNNRMLASNGKAHP